MATISYPTSGNHWLPEVFEAELRTNCLVSTSPLNGAIRTYEIPGARWVFRLTYGAVGYAEQAEREALFSELGGMANRLALWHMARPTPRGTLIGSPTLSATATVGATSLSIATTTGYTVKKGDMLKIGSQLVQVVADATAAAGVLTASIRPAVRAQVASGQAVTWNKPTSEFILSSPGVSIPYRNARGDGFLIELVEAWT